jgi:carboxymethylenebutenolidase
MGATDAHDPDGIIVAPDAVHAERTPGHLALPTSGEGPGILVLDSGRGLDAATRGLCDRFAREGYIAYAPDLNDGRVAGSGAEEEVLQQSMGFDLLVGLLLRAVDRVLEQPGLAGDTLGVVGCGLGGGRSMLLAELRPDRIGSVVTFYGLEPEVHYPATRAAFLGHFAADDPDCPWTLAQRELERIRGAGRDAEFFLYPGTRAGFFEEARPEAFDSVSAAQAWGRSVEFLRERLIRP